MVSIICFKYGLFVCVAISRANVMLDSIIVFMFEIEMIFGNVLVTVSGPSYFLED